MNKITLFTSPKAFEGHNALIQENAFRNWQQLGFEVIVFGNDAGVAEVAAKYNFRHIPNIATSKYGTPLLDDIFNKAQTLASSNIMCYANADIIFSPDFVFALSYLFINFDKCLIIGRRLNLDITEQLDFNADAYAKLNSMAKQNGELYCPTGIDYFVFPKGMIADMPAFCIGRPAWDNWMLWSAKQKNIPIIDITKAVTAYHQNHNYTHIPEGDGKSWENSPEADYNHNIVFSLPGFNFTGLTVLHSDIRLMPYSCSSLPSWKRIVWDLRHYLSRAKRIISKIKYKISAQ